MPLCSYSLTSLKFPQEFSCAQHPKRRQPLSETLGSLIVPAHERKQIVVVRHHMRCRTVNRKFDKRLIVWIPLQAEAGIDSSDILADESQAPQNKLYCFLRNLRIAAQDLRRTKDAPIFRLNRT